MIGIDTEKELLKTLEVDVEINQIFINEYNINYTKVGKGPPLLLIHGANFGWGVWYPNIPELAKHFTVYAIDLPGAGRSTRINYKKLQLQKDLVSTVDQFIQELNLRNFHIAGCSVGGWLALKIALIHPEWVNKVVIENTVGFSDSMKLSEKVIGVYPFAKLISKTVLNPHRKNKKNIEKFLMGIFYDPIDIKKEFVDYFCETMETSHNLLFISRMVALWKEFLLKEDLLKIQNKILVVWGEKDKMMPLEKSITNISLISTVMVESVKDAGHIPSLEKPEEFNALVVDFLKEI
ncbi:MAG: alpha/beta hydrolase [Candidatus Pacebacteria bacterium]|nr:alpha/beta hydrolase [Candidatus Paceibacterota bacterium]